MLRFLSAVLLRLKSRTSFGNSPRSNASFIDLLRKNNRGISRGLDFHFDRSFSSPPFLSFLFFFLWIVILCTLETNNCHYEKVNRVDLSSFRFGARELNEGFILNGCNRVSGVKISLEICQEDASFKKLD